MFAEWHKEKKTFRSNVKETPRQEAKRISLGHTASGMSVLSTTPPNAPQLLQKSFSRGIRKVA